MNSWKLFQLAPHLWNRTQDTHPLFLRETLYPPAWYGMSFRVGRWFANPLLLIVGVIVLLLLFLPWGYGAVALTGLLCLLSPIMLIAPSLVIWSVVLGIALGPLIVRERVERTWDILRSTPLTLEDILRHKLRGGLWWLRGPIRNMQLVLLTAALGVALVAINEPLTYDNRPPAEAAPLSEVALNAGLAIGAAALFLADRGQQFVAMTLAALTGSALAANRPSAIPNATLSAFGLWCADIVIALVVLLANAPGVDRLPGLVVAVWLGPVGGYLVGLTTESALLFAALTLVVREMMIRNLWQFTLHAAART